jgi:hypothetical protein
MASQERDGREAAIGLEPMYRGFADLCLTTWLRRHDKDFRPEGERYGAGNGIRTRDLNLGKVALYH